MSGALKITDASGLSFFDIGGAETKIDTGEEIRRRLPDHIVGSMHDNQMAGLADCALTGKPTWAGAQAAVEAMDFCLGMMAYSETGKVIRF